MSVEWNEIAAISTAVTGIIILLSVVVLAWQIHEICRATYAQAYSVAVHWLNNEETRTARRIVFGLTGKTLKEWTNEERQQAERVCLSYDIVAIMVRNGMLPKKILVDSWGQSLKESWRLVAPLVMEFRQTKSFLGKWDDFQWLAGEAEAYWK